MNRYKLLKKLLSGSKNIRFGELVKCAESFGFILDRINGSHHIFIHKQVKELLNLQSVGGKAKPYQIKQFLQLIEKYNLDINE
jgi:predicted RNA binding protein YcfA (HicA-like mRNA interferase family)